MQAFDVGLKYYQANYADELAGLGTLDGYVRQWIIERGYDLLNDGKATSVSVNKVLHPEAIHPVWLRDPPRRHIYHTMHDGGDLIGEINLSPAGSKPVIYRWKMADGSAQGQTFALVTAKRKVERAFFEKAIGRNLQSQKEKRNARLKDQGRSGV